MKLLVLTFPALAAGLVLAAGPGRADAHLVSLAPPVTVVQAPAVPRVPAPRLVLPTRPVLPLTQPPNMTVMPHSYMIYGLKSGPAGAFCTERNGAAIPMPFNPQIIMGPRTAPPQFSLPFFPGLPAPKKLPTPEKLPRK